MLYFIEQTNIKNLIIDLVKRWNVVAPIEQDGKDVLLEKLPESSEKLEKYLGRISLNSKTANKQTLIPPKEIFFPQSELMFTYSTHSTAKKEFKIESPASTTDTDTAKPVLFFGIKPCDYYALNITGSFFKNGFEDFYYLSKSKNYLALIFGCITPPEPESCFCSSAGTGPVLSKEKGQDFDIQFIEENAGGYFVETGTDRGDEFIKANSRYFKDLSDRKSSVKRLKDIKERAFKNIELSVDFEKALTIMEEGARSGDTSTGLLNSVYGKIADRCIYCGSCLYACPTCTCFNIYDSTESTVVASERTFPLNGERVRVWDACVFSGYTREASGHNPRGESYTRAARRYEHKLKYDPAVYGRSSCTGCGRCLTACPVNIGMSTFIREITENHEK
ncbi:MAG: hypothetical protein DRP57_05750 [Spirochaetes bacterium]|nr:MAG: hypothetical protein DRP57_05750 [Spirochaetota bacterium]